MAAKKPVLALAGVPRVNLLPSAEVDRRERLSLTRVWALLAIAAVIVAALVIAGAFALRVGAEQRLAAEQGRTNDLLAELQSYADVSNSVAARGQLESFRAEALSTDTSWTELLDRVTSHLPKGTTLIEFSLAPGATPVAGDPALGIGAVGSLTLQAVAPDAQAAAVAALGTVGGVAAVDAGELHTAGQKAYEFIVTIAFDQTVYSGRYAQEGAK